MGKWLISSAVRVPRSRGNRCVGGRKHATRARAAPLVCMRLRSRASFGALAAFGILVFAGPFSSAGCATGALARFDGDASVFDAGAGADAEESPLPSFEDASADAADGSVKTGEDRVVEAFPNCPLSLFENSAKPEDFSSDATLKQSWTPQWVAPKTAAGGSLQVGPHPLTAHWWENYSAMSSIRKPGDVLVCARIRMVREASAEIDVNVLEFGIRVPDGASYEASGVTLQLRPNDTKVLLHTRTGADTWTTHDSKPFSLPKGTSTLDVLLFARGTRFVAQVRNVDTGQTTELSATYIIPLGGALTMVGWRQASPTFVDRMVVGVPTVAIEKRLFAQ